MYSLTNFICTIHFSSLMTIVVSTWVNLFFGVNNWTIKILIKPPDKKNYMENYGIDQLKVPKLYSYQLWSKKYSFILNYAWYTYIIKMMWKMDIANYQNQFRIFLIILLFNSIEIVLQKTKVHNIVKIIKFSVQFSYIGGINTCGLLKLCVVFRIGSIYFMFLCAM